MPDTPKIRSHVHVHCDAEGNPVPMGEPGDLEELRKYASWTKKERKQIMTISEDELEDIVARAIYCGCYMVNTFHGKPTLEDEWAEGIEASCKATSGFLELFRREARMFIDAARNRPKP